MIHIIVQIKFVSGNPNTSRELLLKKLDNSIRIIPILDESRRLIDLITKENLSTRSEGAVFARARAPVRVSFGGGGSDLTHYFSSNGGGAVINSTISIYSHATLRIRKDQRVIIRSIDLGEELEAADLQTAFSMPGKFELVKAVLRSINPLLGLSCFYTQIFHCILGLVVQR